MNASEDGPFQVCLLTLRRTIRSDQMTDDYMRNECFGIAPYSTISFSSKESSVDNNMIDDDMINK